MYGCCSVVKSKQGLCSHDLSPLLYALPVSPPTIQHLLPVAAPVITALAGVPQAQSLAVPPVAQLPLFASKPSVYGKIFMGVAHCALAFCEMQNRQVNKTIVPADLCKSNLKFIN